MGSCPDSGMRKVSATASCSIPSLAVLLAALLGFIVIPILRPSACNQGDGRDGLCLYIGSPSFCIGWFWVAGRDLLAPTVGTRGQVFMIFVGYSE